MQLTINMNVILLCVLIHHPEQLGQVLTPNQLSLAGSNLCLRRQQIDLKSVHPMCEISLLPVPMTLDKLWHRKKVSVYMHVHEYIRTSKVLGRNGIRSGMTARRPEYSVFALGPTWKVTVSQCSLMYEICCFKGTVSVTLRAFGFVSENCKILLSV